MHELLIATNPDEDSRLGYLIKVPLGDGIVLRTSDTWPRAKALYCYPVPSEDWPSEPDIIERVPLRACTRRGAAIDLVAARSRENRSQLVFTTAPRPRPRVLAVDAYAQAGPAVGRPAERPVRRHPRARDGPAAR